MTFVIYMKLRYHFLLLLFIFWPAAFLGGTIFDKLNASFSAMIPNCNGVRLRELGHLQLVSLVNFRPCAA